MPKVKSTLGNDRKNSVLFSLKFSAKFNYYLLVKRFDTDLKIFVGLYSTWKKNLFYCLWITCIYEKKIVSNYIICEK